MKTENGRDKIAENLLHAFQAFKKRYDGSMESAAKPVVQEEPRPEPQKAEEPAPEAPAGIQYGIQVLASTKKMAPGDPFFKGYTPLEVRVDRLYKYILVPGEDLSAVRKKLPELSKKYPGCFIVKKDGETLTRIR